ncbi:hypothetical protein [Curtobacterium aurantiacum]|uniref:hypothetical protein n=1 Tax=Curtobacterium aurantiacum TaxID=3236919 RepID=UPI001BDF3B8C|nr:hypothetical protein [Curtobacterium flaccumfaciens]MBT1679533.1 hypothetical protein [Curtobacterium flaccumfaciens pv. flaccumfaciens]
MRSLHVDGLRERFGEVVVTADDVEAIVAVVLAAAQLHAHLPRGTTGLQVGVAVLVDDRLRAGAPGLVVDRRGEDEPREVVVVVEKAEAASHLVRERPERVVQHTAD